MREVPAVEKTLNNNLEDNGPRPNNIEVKNDRPLSQTFSDQVYYHF